MCSLKAAFRGEERGFNSDEPKCRYRNVGCKRKSAVIN